MNGISALIKETPESLLTFPSMWGQSKKTTVCEPHQTQHLPHLDLALPSPQSCEKKCCLSHWESGIFVTAAGTDQNTGVTMMMMVVVIVVTYCIVCMGVTTFGSASLSALRFKVISGRQGKRTNVISTDPGRRR